MKRIEKLNEELSKVLNEISSETRQAVVDARKQNALDAMDKYAKSKSLADRHAKLGDVESSTNIDEPSKDELPIDQVLSGTYVEEPGKPRKWEVVASQVNSLDDDQLQEFLRDSGNEGYNDLYPSGWNYEKFGDYPVKLAEALSELNDSFDNLTDLYNFYYKKYARSASKETLDVFASAIDTNNLSLYEYDDIAEPMSEVIKAITKDYPFLAQEVLDVVDEYLSADEFDEYFADIEKTVRSNARRARKTV